MVRKFVSFILVLAFVLPSMVMAEATSSSVTSESNDDKKSILNSSVLNSNLSGEIIKNLGEPGYYFEKYLNYRRQISQPACTMSEQLNKLSVITALVGDVTTHAFDFFEIRKLKKKYQDKISQIDKYRDDLANQHKKILDYDPSAPNIQFDSLNFLRDSAKVELKRVEMVRAFTYTTLGLQISSKVMAHFESAAEASSLGSSAAATNSCKVAKAPEQATEEANIEKRSIAEAKVDAHEASEAAKVQARLDGAPKEKTRLQKAAEEENVPWYLIPFQYLAKGLSFVESSDPYKTMKEYKGSQSATDMLDDADMKKLAQNGKASDFVQIADSAAYAEDMLVDIVTDVIQKWQAHSKNPEEDINSFNKEKDTSGLMKIVKKIGLDRMAIRYAVRSIVKANILQVNAFMRSGIGRITIFAYNVYVTYRTISVTEAQIDYTKKKIALLDDAIKKLETKTKPQTTTSLNFMNMLTLNPAYAATVTNYNFPKPPCLKYLLPTCSVSNKDIIPHEVVTTLKTLPNNIQNEEKKILFNSYSFKSAMKLATGEGSYEGIDVEKTKDEIKKLEKMSDDLEKQDPKTKKNIASYQKLKNDEKFFPSLMLASYHSTEKIPNEESRKQSDKTKAMENNTIPLKSISEAKVIDANEEEISSEKNNYDIPDPIHSKEDNLFQIINNRYNQIFHSRE